LHSREHQLEKPNARTHLFPARRTLGIELAIIETKSEASGVTFERNLGVTAVRETRVLTRRNGGVEETFERRKHKRGHVPARGGKKLLAGPSYMISGSGSPLLRLSAQAKVSSRNPR
jgi:hypothetical protein